MIKPVSKSNPLFCEQYWKNIAKNTKPVKEYKSTVSTHFELHPINIGFLKLYLGSDIGRSLQIYVAQTDKEFKQLTPTDKPLVLWRGVSEPLKDDIRYPRFEHSYNCKAGDRIFMPEYAFAAKDEKLAQGFAKSINLDKGNGIVYKILVPKDSKISHNPHLAYFNFPRFSIFECLDTQEVKENGYKYKLITIQYIQPKEINIEDDEKN